MRPAARSWRMARLRGGGAKAGENLDAYGKGGEAGAEGFFVLLREDGGGDQHRRLLPGGGNPEGGADGDFGLPVADIADDDAVHGAGAGLVGADGLGGGGLIGRFNEGEGGFPAPYAKDRRAGWRPPAGSRARRKV